MITAVWALYAALVTTALVLNAIHYRRERRRLESVITTMARQAEEQVKAQAMIESEIIYGDDPNFYVNRSTFLDMSLLGHLPNWKRLN